MLSLELHSSHQQQPKQVFVFVVSARGDLVINEGHLRVLRESHFFLVVSDQDESRVESCDEATNDEACKISTDQVERQIVNQNKRDINLNIIIYTQFLLFIADSSESYLHLRYKKG